MKKWTAMLSGFAVATLLLTGCSTSNNDKEESQKVDNTSTNETQNNASQKEATNTTQDTTEATAQEQTSETSKEQKLQYVFQNENKEETALLKTSTNQPFSLYVLPKFELSAEEPGKDVVLFTNNDQIFMRIELLPEDVDWAATEKNIKAQLNSISDTITDPGLKIEEGSSYEVTTKDNDVVTAVLLKNKKARLTMYTTKDADYRDAFLQMAKTIQK